MGHRFCRWISGLRTRFVSAVVYRVLVRAIHHPALLRMFGDVILKKMHVAGAVASYGAVSAVFQRTANLSSLAHRSDLPCNIEFVIAMEQGPTHTAERALLKRVIAEPRDFGEAAMLRGQALADGLRAKPTFDLIDDYLMDVVWSACRTSFGDAAPAIESYAPSGNGGCPVAALYAELRHVGAALLGGAASPRAVRDNAYEKARALKERVASCSAKIAAAWPEAGPVTPKVLNRNAVGLMWVGHPATVQAGALIMQSLLADPTLYRGLREAAQQLGANVWTDTAFRTELKAHVLELLRFRPPFPLLNRMVLRDAWIDADGAPKPVKAGGTVIAVTAAAMFDKAAVDEPARYWPGRPDAAFSDPDNRYLMFGLGERSCIAKHQVVETLAGALTGLLTLGELRYAKRWSRITYDGPTITRMSLRFA